MSAKPAGIKTSKKRTAEAVEEDGGLQLFSTSVVKAVKNKKKKVINTPVSAEAGETKASKTKQNDEPDTLKVDWLEVPHDPMADFAKLGVAQWQIDILKRVSITKPTEIQQKCIPTILSGRDLVGRAKTGSGKTATFALPILQNLAKDPYGIFALVLTPTRELAYQIEDQFKVLGAPLNVETCVVVGGLDMVRQSAIIASRPHILIATPGRLSDLLIRGGLNFHGDFLRYLVLDEADRLFDPCFAPFIETILDYIPPVGERQTLMFSATITKEMLKANIKASTGAALPQLLHNPVYVQVNASEDNTVVTLDQSYLLLPQAVKEVYLYHLLKEKIGDQNESTKNKVSVVVFANTCTGVAFLSNLLTHLGIPNVPLHSKVPQSQRLANLGKFRSAYVPVLVCTDVAARGLDIPSVQFVCNYDVPRIAEDYIHRVGRTARAGRGGSALTLVSQYDIELYKQIEQTALHKELSALEIDEAEVLTYLKAVTEAKKYVQISMRDYGLVENKPKKKMKLSVGSD